MKSILSFILAVLTLSSFSQQSPLSGDYIMYYPDNDGYEYITIADNRECYDVIWKIFDANGKEGSSEIVETKCQEYDIGESNVYFLIWGEEYEITPIDWDEDNLVSQFEIPGFDEVTIFNRVYE